MSRAFEHRRKLAFCMVPKRECVLILKMAIITQTNSLVNKMELRKTTITSGSVG